MTAGIAGDVRILCQRGNLGFSPGSLRVHKDTADIPFRHEDRPLTHGSADEKEALE